MLKIFNEPQRFTFEEVVNGTLPLEDMVNPMSQGLIVINNVKLFCVREIQMVHISNARVDLFFLSRRGLDATIIYNDSGDLIGKATIRRGQTLEFAQTPLHDEGEHAVYRYEINIK